MKRTLFTLLRTLAAVLWLNLQISTAPAQLITFTNPTPAAGDWFGHPLTALGSDRVLIAAHQDSTYALYGGAVYLFNTNGALLTTFTNPTPARLELFGSSVEAVGTDRVLIAAYGATPVPVAAGAGAAYLFGTNGTLITTFTNPTPALNDQFAYAVAALGTDRGVIGAYGDDTGASDAGAAYLFDTNGSLLTTFTNPAPAAGDSFGFSVAAVGTDRVLIGAPYDDAGASGAGTAYLFGINGTLFTTFTNPAPADNDFFGRSVAALGTDRLLIGAYGDDMGASDAGTAYLFSTNGALLTTFTNPTPADYDYFGVSVAAVGTDRVLIGAYQDSASATNAGAAYLFNTNGVLLATFTKTIPAANDYFGISVAAVGTDRVLIGAPRDDTGASAAGAAYLFSLEPLTPEVPLLSITRDPQFSILALSWPAPAEGWVLEYTNALPFTAVTSWPQVPPPYQTNAGTIFVTFTNDPAAENQFFRLHKQ